MRRRPAAHLKCRPEEVEAARARCAGFKTIAAYRTGLAVQADVTLAEAHRSAVAARHGLPVQFHTGFGDSDLRLSGSNPLLLEDLLHTEEGTAATVVLIHGGFPWTEELGYLALSRPAVYAEQSLSSLFAPLTLAERITRLLELVPADRLMFGTDGHGQPETLWFAACAVWDAWERAEESMSAAGRGATGSRRHATAPSTGTRGSCMCAGRPRDRTGIGRGPCCYGVRCRTAVRPGTAPAPGGRSDISVRGKRGMPPEKDEAKPTTDRPPRRHTGTRPAAGPPPLDQTDLQILTYLATDARMSQRAIARAIGMSAPAIADRIARLESAGVIQGYRAKIDYALLDRGLNLVVGITSERSANQRELAQAILGIPEVEQVDVVTGASDLQVRLRVRDQAHFNEVYFERLLEFEGIRHTDTALVLYSYEPENFAQQVLASLPESDENSTGTEDELNDVNSQ